MDLSSEDPSGTILFNPTVTLDGMTESLQTTYDVPAGSTLQFLLPANSDTYFTVEGQVFAGGVEQLDFAYEDQLAAPEPATAALLACGVLLLALIRRRLRSRSLSSFCQ